MKPLKKSAKIALGTAVTVFILAVIAVIVVFAVKDITDTTILYSKKYDQVVTDSTDTVILNNGYFIAVQDGKYVLVKDNTIVSKRYASLKLIDAKRGLYEFSTTDGHFGVIDSSGTEIQKAKSNGNFINNLYVDKDYSFVIEKAKGDIRAVANGTGGTWYDGDITSILTYQTMFYNLSLTNIPEGTAAGVYYYETSEGFFLASVYSENAIKSTDIKKIDTHYVVTEKDSQTAVYSLPSFTKVEIASSTASSDILFFKENIFTLAEKDSKFTLTSQNGQSFTFDVKPTAVRGYANGTILVSDAANAYYLNSGENIVSGNYGVYGGVFKIGGKVYANKTLKYLDVESSSAQDRVIIIDNDLYFYIFDSSLYLFDGEKLTKYIDKLTSYMAMKDGYYFIGDGKIYDFNLKAIANAQDKIIVNDNLLSYGGTTFSDFSGKHEIADVISYKRGENFDANDKPFYFFKKSDGYYTFNGRVASKEFLEEHGFSFDDSDITVLKTANDIDVAKITIGGKIIYIVDDECFHSADYVNGTETFGQNFIAAFDQKYMAVYKITKKGFSLEEKYYYNSFIGADTAYADNLSLLIFETDGGTGVINHKGKLVLNPVYEGIEIGRQQIIALKANRYAAFNLNGKQLTDYSYVMAAPLGDYLMVVTADFKTQILDQRGKVIVKEVQSIIKSKNYIYKNGAQVLDETQTHYFILADGKCRLLKVINN